MSLKHLIHNQPIFELTFGKVSKNVINQAIC